MFVRNNIMAGVVVISMFNISVAPVFAGGLCPSKMDPQPIRQSRTQGAGSQPPQVQVAPRRATPPTDMLAALALAQAMQQQTTPTTVHVDGITGHVTIFGATSVSTQLAPQLPGAIPVPPIFTERHYDYGSSSSSSLPSDWHHQISPPSALDGHPVSSLSSSTALALTSSTSSALAGAHASSGPMSGTSPREAVEHKNMKIETDKKRS